MKEFMLLYKGGDPDWMSNTSEAEQKATMEAWGAWMGGLQANDQLVNGGSPLGFTGKHVSKDGVITDIAASEIKELVTGYSVIKAANYEAAAAIAKECPIFRYPEASLDVREVFKM